MAEDAEQSDQNHLSPTMDMEREGSKSANEDDDDVVSKMNSEEWGEHVRQYQTSRQSASGSGQFRKSTEEHLQMKRDEFWATHKESIEEQRQIDALAEYHEQVKLMQQIKEEEEAAAKAEALQQSQLRQQMMKLTQRSNPSPEQLQLSLQQIDQMLQQLPSMLQQTLQSLQQSVAPMVTQLTNQLNAAKANNDTAKIQQFQLQQQAVQQQFQAQWAALHQEYNDKVQQLKVNRLNTQNALQRALSLQQQLEQRQASIQSNNTPEYVPSFMRQSDEEGSPNTSHTTTDPHDSGDHRDKHILNKNRMFTINEDDTHSLSKKSQTPYIVDTAEDNIGSGLTRRLSKGDNDEVLNESLHSVPIPSTTLHVSRSNGSSCASVAHSVTHSNHGLTLVIPPMEEKLSRSASRVTSQSISSQNTQNTLRSSHQSHHSHQSVSKSLTPNAPSPPSISPMKLSHHESSPNDHPFKPPAVPSMMGLTQSLPTTPVQTPAGRVRLQSLAEISRISLTPEFKAQQGRKPPNSRTNKTQTGGAYKGRGGRNGRNDGVSGVQSLPNSPRYSRRAENDSNRKIPIPRSKATGRVSPLILNGQHRLKESNTTKDHGLSIAYKYAANGSRNEQHGAFPDVRNINENECELSKSPSCTGSIELSQRFSDRSTSTSASSSDGDDDRKSSAGNTNVSHQDSHRSLYSYSSMSTVFTGVHDGALLANKYLSKMEPRYNKLEVLKDIKSLWFQVFPTPLLLTLVLTLTMTWISKFGGDTDKLAGFLLGIAVFNMIGHLMIKGMSSTLSSLCDQLYAANCKPLIGVQLQKMMGFAIVIIIPLVCGTMQIVALGLEVFWTDYEDTINAMHKVVNYCMFAVPPLTMFYIFQRYLQGSHTLHIHKYTAICGVGAIIFQSVILVVLQTSFDSALDSLSVVLISLITSYWMLLAVFIAIINIYKLHSETYIFRTSWKHLCCVWKWGQYLNHGFYRSALLFCDNWYFDFAIILAANQGINELIAFGLLCNLYHLIMKIICAFEFVAKSLIFRGLSHSVTAYARDAWKYSLISGIVIALLIGGGCFLCREWISRLLTSDPTIRSLMNESWIYLYILLVCNAVKSGLVGGAQAMGYVNLVSSMNLFSFYVITIPVSVWFSTLFQNEGLHPIYGSILLGNAVCIFGLIVFRLCINWRREMEQFDLRKQREAELLQQSVEAVHLELQHLTERYHQNNGYRNHQSLSLQIQRDRGGGRKQEYSKKQYNSHCNECRHHRHHSKRRRKSEHRKRNGDGKAQNNKPFLYNNPSDQSSKSLFPRQGTNLTNSSSESYGRMLVTSFDRMKTGDTFKGVNLGSSGTLITFDDDDRDGEPRPPPEMQQREERDHVEAAERRYQEQMLRTQRQMMRRRRRTFWGDLWEAIKRYCCCCLFGECCCECEENGCCREWIWYCCGCCCADSYLDDGYDAPYHSGDAHQMGYVPVLSKNGAGSSGGTTASSAYSNYHFEINPAKYTIIHEEAGCNATAGSGNGNGLAWNGNGKKKKGDDVMKQSLLRHHDTNYSMDGVGAGYMKSSMDQADPLQNTMRSDNDRP